MAALTCSQLDNRHHRFHNSANHYPFSPPDSMDCRASFPDHRHSSFIPYQCDNFHGRLSQHSYSKRKFSAFNDSQYNRFEPVKSSKYSGRPCAPNKFQRIHHKQTFQRNFKRNGFKPFVKPLISEDRASQYDDTILEDPCSETKYNAPFNKNLKHFPTNVHTESPPVSPHVSVPRSNVDFTHMDELEGIGVNPFGTMEGLIHLKSPITSSDAPQSTRSVGDGFNEESASAALNCNSISEHGKSLKVTEDAVDSNLQHFELVKAFDFNSPNANSRLSFHARILEQDTQIAFLEEENLNLKERLFIAQREVRELRRMKRSPDDELETLGDDDEASCYSSSSPRPIQ